MKPHPFRTAVESHAPPEQFAKLFSPDAILNAPILSKPVSEVDQIVNFISHAVQVAGKIEYSLEVMDGNRYFLIWHAKIDGFQLDSATVLTYGDDGLVHDITVLMRPWPVVARFQKAMHERLCSIIPAVYWEAGPTSAPKVWDRKFTSLALQQIEFAPEIVLHSPMLAKSVSGRENVEIALKAAHSIQTPSSFKSVVATTDHVLELFDCDVEGHPLEGLNLRKLDEQGRVIDFAVMLRPWPAVGILRDRVKDLNVPLFTPDHWDLPEHA